MKLVQLLKQHRQASKEERREFWRRRRFLVPNAVTLGNMFCGFLATIYASTGRYEKAAIAIGIAILLDGLDGRVARRLNATSQFGVEFDSFSDLVSFGVAPASLIYYWCFQEHADEFGVIICFLYVICAASRLARFNITEPNLRSFVGLPTPGAAGMVAALVNFYPHISGTPANVGVMTFGMISLSFLMVSNLPFLSVKKIRFGSMKLFARLGLGLLIALIWYNSGTGFLVLAACYVLSGPLKFVKGALTRNRSTRA